MMNAAKHGDVKNNLGLVIRQVHDERIKWGMQTVIEFQENESMTKFKGREVSWEVRFSNKLADIFVKSATYEDTGEALTEDELIVLTEQMHDDGSLFDIWHMDMCDMENERRSHDYHCG